MKYFTHNIRFGVALFMLLLAHPGLAQEVLTGLQGNPVIRARLATEALRRSPLAEADTTPVTLPFFDDFSKGDIFPSSDRWSDRYTFRNTDIPVYPINLGAITFDAVNDSGKMYSNAVPGPATFIADYLTSRKIRLDSIFDPVAKALTPADSVFLSFYYQPQGRGRAPETSDSLTLQFFIREGYDSITPTDTIPIPALWKKVWNTKGMALDTFLLNNGRYFVQVIIPITDPIYFKRDFRFRFFNRVSLASSTEPSWQSNCDQWNLDNIYLNAGRSVFDTVYSEIRFIERPPSLLRRYESMPYPHYTDDPTNELRDTIDVLISNRDLQQRNCHYQYELESPDGSFQKTYDGGDYNVNPFYTSGYVTYPPFAHPPVPYLFPLYQLDSAQFLMTHIIRENVPGTKLGDTITAWQKFYNYFAYDDGTPEASYGLSVASGKLAYRFRLNKSPDTVRAVDLYFNRTLGGNNVQFFYLCIWDDNAGKPGDTIYSDLVEPVFADSLNEFVTYHLDRPVRVAGSFYVGWIQTTTDNLSIGFDEYNESQENILYNVTGQWLSSSYSGSLMIRPKVGKPLPTGIPVTAKEASLQVYPNPSDGSNIRIIYPQSLDITGYSIEIVNLYGQVVHQEAASGSISVTHLPPAMYLLALKDKTGRRTATSRIVITP